MSLPSRAIVKICVLPARVEENARCRPLGDQLGLSLLPSPNVNWRTVLVARSITLMSSPGPVRDANAISLYGGGDHVARSQYGSEVIFRSPVLSTPTT